MPPLTYIHAFEAARTTTGGGALSGSENCLPPQQAAKGLRQTKTAQGSPEAERRVSVPQRDRDAPFRASVAGGCRLTR